MQSCTKFDVPILPGLKRGHKMGSKICKKGQFFFAQGLKNDDLIVFKLFDKIYSEFCSNGIPKNKIHT